MTHLPPLDLDPRKACPKCGLRDRHRIEYKPHSGWYDIFLVGQSFCDDPINDEPPPPPDPYMKRWCARCAYTWAEATVEDKPAINDEEEP